MATPPPGDPAEPSLLLDEPSADDDEGPLEALDIHAWLEASSFELDDQLVGVPFN
jgi:hypothetical protein